VQDLNNSEDGSEVHLRGPKGGYRPEEPQLPKHLENALFSGDREREQYEINPRAIGEF
jgi:hypothetical protein